jgi:hypothetical protein
MDIYEYVRYFTRWKRRGVIYVYTRRIQPRIQPRTLAGGGGDCQDMSRWKDSDGDGCELYEDNDDPGCPNYGDGYANDAGVDANSACCYCGGGSAGGGDAPTPDPSPDRTPDSGGDCQDMSGRLDADGLGCDSYNEWDDPGCPAFGQYNENDEELQFESGFVICLLVFSTI